VSERRSLERVFRRAIGCPPQIRRARQLHREIQPAFGAAGQPLHEHLVRRAGKDFTLELRRAHDELDAGQRGINVQP
jgi:hypothetical protein